MDYSVRAAGGPEPQPIGLPELHVSNQSQLPEAKYEEKTSLKELPTWCESLMSNVKMAGLGVTAALCGVLAIGLLPLSIVGFGLLYQGHTRAQEVGQKDVKAQILLITGAIIGLPVVGLFASVGRIKQLVSFEQAKHFAHQALVSTSEKEGTSFQKKFTKVIKGMKKDKNPDLPKIEHYIDRVSKEYPKQINEKIKQNLTAIVFLLTETD